MTEQAQRTTLTEQDLAVLALEKAWWLRPGSKEQAIYDAFGWTPTAYYRRLNTLVDRQEALAAEPVVVKRLRELRARRARARSLARTG